MVEYDYIMLNDIGKFTYDESKLLNIKKFDLTTDVVNFIFDEYDCILDCDNNSKTVELFMTKLGNRDRPIRYESYYMSTGYYCFMHHNRVLLIYIDLTRSGYVVGLDNF